MGKVEKPRPQASGQYAFDGLDRVLHEKARLGILSSLVANPEGLVFSELKELCDLTDGNLSRHMQVLQDAGLVEVWKGTHGNRPQTLVRLSDIGRERFLNYIALLEQIVASAQHAADSASENLSTKQSNMGWNPA